VPGIEAHFAAVRHGLGYAMVPEWLLSSAGDGNDPLIDLAPKRPTDVALY
jgi:LysR family transcriptional regulator (chromosome initiation inhibitor)